MCRRHKIEVETKFGIYMSSRTGRNNLLSPGLVNDSKKRALAQNFYFRTESGIIGLYLF